jgi:hypothetical protein
LCIYYFYVYICMGANILLSYMLHLSMYLYTEYSVYTYMEYVATGVLLINASTT